MKKEEWIVELTESYSEIWSADIECNSREEQLNKVFYNWHKKHNLFPTCYRVLNEEVIEVCSTGLGGGKKND